MVLQPVSYQNYTDELLVELITDGKTFAFDELYKRYGQKLFSYFFRMLWKNKELAEDCTQELFFKLIKNMEKFDKQKNFSTWMYSIANNMCKNEYRKEETRLKYQNMKPQAGIDHNKENVDMGNFKKAVSGCINELNEDKKSLFILRFNEQLSVPDISKILNIPEGTVKSRLFYLLKELKDKLAPFQNISFNQ
ncbi:MAG: sigma-70 family RNA polymerase sigma factor [Chitinophagaceae bacterium]|nr:sigma-70 family RNA polymerase sigma factor [Chitinophagaceae bacterium]